MVIFSCNKKPRDRWLLVLFQQLLAIGAEVFIILLPLFHGCKMMAVAAFPDLEPTFQAGERKNGKEQRMYATESFKDISRRPIQCLCLYFIDQNYVIQLLLSVWMDQKHVLSTNISIPSNVWFLLISKKRKMDIGLEARSLCHNYIPRAEKKL